MATSTFYNTILKSKINTSWTLKRTNNKKRLKSSYLNNLKNIINKFALLWGEAQGALMWPIVTLRWPIVTLRWTYSVHRVTWCTLFIFCTKCEGKFVPVAPTSKMLLSMCSVLAWAGGRADGWQLCQPIKVRCQPMTGCSWGNATSWTTESAVFKKVWIWR